MSQNLINFYWSIPGRSWHTKEDSVFQKSVHGRRETINNCKKSPRGPQNRVQYGPCTMHSVLFTMHACMHACMCGTVHAGQNGRANPISRQMLDPNSKHHVAVNIVGPHHCIRSGLCLLAVPHLHPHPRPGQTKVTANRQPSFITNLIYIYI